MEVEVESTHTHYDELEFELLPQVLGEPTEENERLNNEATNWPLSNDDSDVDNVDGNSSDDDDVVIQVDVNNNLTTSTSLLDNYLHQSEELSDLCYWDYISQVEKVSKASDC